MMKDNSNFQSRQKTRKFFRILNSKKLSTHTQSNIYIVLNEFDSRGLSFNNHYIKFFTLFLSCQEDVKRQVVFDNVLDFLISNKQTYTNIQLKNLFTDIERFLKFNTLNVENNFTWKCVGDFNLSFELNGNPYFQFKNSELSVLNSRDTVTFFNTIGRYDIVENVFYGESGESDFFNDDIFIDFNFNEFTLNLNQQFFEIQNALMSSVGTVNVTCSGLYKNKLSSSEKYPHFYSYMDTLNSELFDGFNIVSGVQTKGGNFSFNSEFGPIELRFHDDKIEYLFISDHFKVKNSQLSSLEASFSFQNDIGSIYHPSVTFSYDDNEKKIFIERLSGKRGLNPIRNTFHGLNIFADKLEVDLIDDNCLLFHYSKGRDVNILFESDNYFDEDKYRDIARVDINPLSLLIQFYESKDVDKAYRLKEFSKFIGLNLSDALNLLLELELFGFVRYNNFSQLFKVKSWAFNFFDSHFGEYDHDSFRIESIAGVGDTVAEIDLYLNTMDIYRVQKMKITNRFSLSIYPTSNRLSFFKDKSFLMDGNIDIGFLLFLEQK